MEINEGAALEAEKIASDYLARLLGTGRAALLYRDTLEEV